LSEEIKNAIYKNESYLKLGFLVGMVLPILGGGLLRSLGFAINLMALVRMCGIPNLGPYFPKLLKNDFFYNLLYVIIISIVGSYTTTVFFFPLGVHFLLGASIFLTQNPDKLSFIMKVQSLANMLNVACKSKDSLMETKCYTELAVAVYMIILAAIGKGSIVAVLVYLPFLAFKWTQIPSMQASIYKLRRLVQ